jgi:hypothetical protein
MGYRAKPELAHLLMSRRIDRIHRYPKSGRQAGARTTFILPSVWPTEEIRDQKAPMLPGPVLAWGDFYCPAAMDRLAGNPTERIRKITEDPAGLDRFDKMLAERLPFVMGRLDRPRLRDVKRAARLPGKRKISDGSAGCNARRNRGAFGAHSNRTVWTVTTPSLWLRRTGTPVATSAVSLR